MKSEKGVILISLLTYVAILLTVMVIIGRITGVFQKRLDNIDAENNASNDYTLLNYTILTEVKKDKATAEIGKMIGGNGTNYTFTPNESDSITGTAIKFGDGNVLGYIGERIYFNKVKIADDVSEFTIAYNKSADTNTSSSISIHAKIGNQEYEQEYTFR